MSLDKLLRPVEAELRYRLFLHQLELQKIDATVPIIAISGGVMEVQPTIVYTHSVSFAALGVALIAPHDPHRPEAHRGVAADGRLIVGGRVDHRPQRW